MKAPAPSLAVWIAAVALCAQGLPGQVRRAPGPTPGPKAKSVQGNLFLEEETNPDWHWRRLSPANAGAFWKSVTRAAGREGKAWVRGPVTLCDVQVAQDGSAFFLGAGCLTALEGEAGGPAAPIVFRSTDGGRTFVELPLALWPLAVSKSDPDVIYGFDGPQLHGSRDGGKTWAILNADVEPTQRTGTLPPWCLRPPGPKAARSQLESLNAAWIVGSTTGRAAGPALPAIRAMVGNAKGMVLKVDVGDSRRLLLGLRRENEHTGREPPAAQDYEREQTQTLGFEWRLPTERREWRLSTDAGRTWQRPDYAPDGQDGWRLVGRAVTYRKQGAGRGSASRLPDQAVVEPSHSALDGLVCPSAVTPGTLYWSGGLPLLSHGRSQGVLVSSNWGQDWKQIGILSESKTIEKPDAPPETVRAYRTFDILCPGQKDGREVLFAAAKETPTRDARVLAVYSREGSSWCRLDIFHLTEPNVGLPIPAGILVQPGTATLCMPLAGDGSGRMQFPGGESLPTAFKGILWSSDGGLQWRLYSTPGLPGDPRFEGPDAAGTVYARAPQHDGVVYCSLALPEAPPPTPPPRDPGTKAAAAQGRFVPKASWKVAGLRLMAVGGDGTVHVVAAPGRETVLLRFSAAGRPMGNPAGSVLHGLRTPQMLAADGTGNAFLFDTMQFKVFCFDRSGTQSACWGERGLGPRQLQGVSALAAAGKEEVWTYQSLNGIVQHFGAKGKLLQRWGEKGEGEGKLGWFVKALAVDGEGTVVVADPKGGCIQRFSAQGRFLGAWGKPGRDAGTLTAPSRVAVAADVVFVCDQYRVQAFTSQGQYIAEVTDGISAYQVNGLAVHGEGLLFVAGTSGEIRSYQLQR